MLFDSIPIVIISYNNHPFVEFTVRQLRERRLENIIVIDNGSEWRDTLDWLGTAKGFNLIRNEKNFGHLCWQRPEVFDHLPDIFCVTDPDLLFNPKLPEDFLKTMVSLALDSGAQRVGFALDISDGHLMFSDNDYHRGKSIVEHEMQFWQQGFRRNGLSIYLARIDTTFHIFNKNGRADLQFRIAGEYTAKHLPWYRNDPVFGAALMTEIYRHATHISTIAKLRLRHSTVSFSGENR
jgi:hypothetical protein